MKYEAPEIVRLGNARTLVLGNSFYNNDCCTCGRTKKPPTEAVEED